MNRLVEKNRELRIVKALLSVIISVAAVVGLNAPVMAGSSTPWKVYNYNPSGNALAPDVPTASGGANGPVSFNFLANTYTALLVSSDKSLTGNLTGKILTDAVSVTGVTGTFQEQNGGGCTPDAQSVRLYFATPGFAFTNFWWSNPVSMPLTGNTAATISASLADPSQWSDWNGQVGNSSPEVTAGFNAAVGKVNTVGLSFGGGCFFENGVTTSDGSGTFSSTFSEN
jgi:hypothetical protein